MRLFPRRVTPNTAELDSLRFQLRMTEARVRQLTTDPPYSLGFEDGVLTASQQLHKWLYDSRAKAREIAKVVDEASGPEWHSGRIFAEAWINEVIRQLDDYLERRARAFSTRYTQDPRGGDSPPE